MSIIVLPVNITFELWANQLWIDLPGQDIPQVTKDTKWREFACQLFNNSTIQNIPFPYKEVYEGEEGWKKWATDFVNNIYV